jgi:transcriptional regulator with XRE-family HTH domain
MSKKDPPDYPGDEAIKKAIGEALRQLRLERGPSIEETAAILKAGPGYPRLPCALGIVVKRLREQQKMSRAQLSSASGLTLRFIINVEPGKADDATVTDIVRLSFGLNQSAEDFVTQVVEVLEKLGQS